MLIYAVQVYLKSISNMLVFKMDTTGLFRYGQKHELKIRFPKDKNRNYVKVRPIPQTPPTSILRRSKNDNYNDLDTDVRDFRRNSVERSNSQLRLRSKELRGSSEDRHPIPPVRRRRKYSSASSRNGRFVDQVHT